jgi:hypothetical protein
MSAGRAARYGVFCGIGAGLAVHTMLLIAARAEGKAPARPFNATSHWLQGQKAGRRAAADIAHTGVGLATNQAAAMFWGTLFGLYVASRRNPHTGSIMRDAAVMGAIATAVDYGLMPKRLTPGWELALSKTSVGLTMAAMALGLGLGGVAARATEE